MEYGINRLGYNEHEKCSKCKWEGHRSELIKDFVYDDNADIENDSPIDEHWVCPNCKTIVIE